MAKFFKVNVSAVIYNSQNQVLIQKRALNEEVFPGLWGIPGGTVEMSDTSLVDALQREVLEEVNINISNIHFFSDHIVAKEMYGVTYIIFTADYSSGEVKALEDTEDTLWLDIPDIDLYEFTPETKSIIKDTFLWKKSQQ